MNGERKEGTFSATNTPSHLRESGILQKKQEIYSPRAFASLQVEIGYSGEMKACVSLLQQQLKASSF